MKHKSLLLIALLLGSTAFAQQETKKEPVSRKRVNNTLGVCMMGKTMQCNGISMSYIASEQGKLALPSVRNMTASICLGHKQQMLLLAV